MTIDFLPAEIREELETTIEEAVTKAIPVGLQKHYGARGLMKEMSVDLTIIDVDNPPETRILEMYSALPAVPPLPERGGTFRRPTEDGRGEVYRVQNIVYMYRHIVYESNRIPEFVTDITVYVRKST